MAKKKSNLNRNIGIGLLITGGIFFMLRNRKQRENEIRYQNAPLPPRPTSQADQWRDWAQRIIDLYGRTKELWEPGGPFYKPKYQGFPPEVINNLPKDPNSTGILWPLI